MSITKLFLKKPKVVFYIYCRSIMHFLIPKIIRLEHALYLCLTVNKIIIMKLHLLDLFNNLLRKPKQCNTNLRRSEVDENIDDEHDVYDEINDGERL